MKRLHIACAAAIILVLAAGSVLARRDTGQPGSPSEPAAIPDGQVARMIALCEPWVHDPGGLVGEAGYLGRGSGTFEDTLWIFDADFEDLAGDNAGWTSTDMSGVPAKPNYWHKDTIRLTEAYLGESTWWCGKYDPCWRQPRGYGNEWFQLLERGFPLSEWSDAGDEVTFEFDQRYAMERDYDYGYVDVSVQGSGSWTTVASYTNVGFQWPGLPVDWDHSAGHQVLDLSGYAGLDVRLRFRFESDVAYSSQDEYDNPQHSVKDGAWQLDNLEWKVNGAPVWFDDCEGPGDNGWEHDEDPPIGQTGAVFHRSYEEIVNPDDPCDVHTGWMMAGNDSVTGLMVDDQFSLLDTPPIDIAGAYKLVGEWEGLVHVRDEANDFLGWYFSSTDNPDCPVFVDECWYWWGVNDPVWVREVEDLDAFAGNDWFFMRWMLTNDEPSGSEPHGAGLILDRVRVGVPVGPLTPTLFEYGPYDRFHDTFDVAEALTDSATIEIKDDDNVASACLLASDDAGATWESYAMVRVSPEANDWRAPPPVNQIAVGREVWYYFQATDTYGNSSVHPKDAPWDHYEFSILPIHASLEEPGILLVDKHGGLTPGEDRSFRHTSEYYYREALEVLGYEFDVFDVNAPSVRALCLGPDTSGMRYYDTQIWFTSDSESLTLRPLDQFHVIEWLAEAAGGAERNLLLTGNDLNHELWDAGAETLDFLSIWLASGYYADDVGDTLPTLRDAVDGFDFMTYGAGECVLRGGCPVLNNFDVVSPTWEIGSETVAEYVTAESGTWPAGSAYTHPVVGYQTVNLGFGIEFMMSELVHVPGRSYVTGVAERADLLGNILEYFGKEPTVTPTDVTEGSGPTTGLGRAYPNPFNPAATLEYALAAPGRVSVRVYDLAGRVVRTLVDEPVEPGEHRAVWDGTTDEGLRAASGVYFVRMETGGFEDARRVVLLK